MLFFPPKTKVMSRGRYSIRWRANVESAFHFEMTRDEGDMRQYLTAAKEMVPDALRVRQPLYYSEELERLILA